MFKKLLFSVIAAVLLFQSTITPAFAANWFDQSIYPWYIKVYSTDISPSNEIFGERYTAAQVQWVVYSLIVVPMHMMFGSEFTACVLEASTSANSSITACFTKVGFLVDLFIKLDKLLTDNTPLQPHNSTLAGLVFQDRQLSGLAYSKNFLRKITHVPEVHAQQAGYGFGALNVVQESWKKSRDISYGLLIFAAIIMSFMIMLRTKISPQAVITAQSAIPQLIFAIILITFSFAIAGFMIDLMYVIIGLVAAVIAPSPEMVATVYNFITIGPMGLGLFGVMTYYVLIFPIFLMVALFSSGAGTSASLGIIFQIAPLTFIIGLLALLVVGILIAFAFLKAIFMLIKTLVSIYLLVIFGPFYILGGTLSKSLGFGSWIKDLASNLIVFPAVGIFFLYAMQFLKWGVDAYAQFLPDNLRTPIDSMMLKLIGQTLTNSLNTGWSPPLLGIGGGGGLMLMFVSMSLILLIPKIADIVKGFMSGRPFAYGTGIGEAFGPVAAGYGYAASGPASKVQALQAAQRAGQTINPAEVEKYSRLARGFKFIDSMVGRKER